MIREERFRISKRPYAVDLGSMRIQTIEPSPEQHQLVRVHHIRIGAVWFRRREGRTVAVLGRLWDICRDPAPGDVHEALRRHRDGRYGGSWIARWDGEDYVSEHPQPPEAMAEHLALLRPMLEGYPAVPAGHDGWWRFETTKEISRG